MAPCRTIQGDAMGPYLGARESLPHSPHSKRRRAEGKSIHPRLCVWASLAASQTCRANASFGRADADAAPPGFPGCAPPGSDRVPSLTLWAGLHPGLNGTSS
jgi:hypothetical protein